MHNIGVLSDYEPNTYRNCRQAHRDDYTLALSHSSGPVLVACSHVSDGKVSQERADSYYSCTPGQLEYRTHNAARNNTDKINPAVATDVALISH
jgi:hypothetical protein